MILIVDIVQDIAAKGLSLIHINSTKEEKEALVSSILEQFTKGDAFGFAAIAKVANEELNKYLPNIIPRLYRYQFDSTPKIQQSMSSIWRTIVPSTNKTVSNIFANIVNFLVI